MTFNAGSTYKVDLVINNNETATDPAYHDNLVVDGKATIVQGSKLSLAISDARPLGAGEKKTIKILEAREVDGKFEIADDYLFINQNIQFKHNFSAVSESDAVYVVVSRSSTNIEDITKNPNENNIVDSIKSKDDNDQSLLDDLNLIRRDDEDKLEEYLKDISGEVYGDLPSVAEDISRSLGGSIRGRFSGFHQFRNLHGSAFGSQTGDKDKTGDKDRERYLPLWVNAHGVFYNHREASGGNAAVDINGGDVQAGMEFGLGQKVYMGLAFMGGMNTVEVKERESKALFTTFGGGLYGGTFFPLGPGDLVLGLGASYGLTFGHIRREVVSGIDIKYQTGDETSQPSGVYYKASLDETLETDYRAHAIQGILDIGWDVPLGIDNNTYVEPYIGGTWLSVLTEAFQEETTAIAHPSKNQAGLPPAKEGRLALEGQAQHKYTIATLLGARVLRDFKRSIFDVDVNWQHIFDPAGNRTKQTIRIMGKRDKNPSGGWFDVEGANADVDTFNGRLGYGFKFGRLRGSSYRHRMLLRASYDVQLGYSTMSHGAELLFEYMF
jgi:outer membrane autotransporter protein